MISVIEASKLISRHLPHWGEESRALGSSLAPTCENIDSDRAYPPFHRVMMDGIAVSFDVYQIGKREFKLSGIAAAGEPQKTLTEKESCLEVMTGAPLPFGTDLVIPYEHLMLEEGKAKVRVEQERARLEHVHLEGSDCKGGDVVLKSGHILNGPHVGIAASMGKAFITTRKNPKILLVSTGDELVEIDQRPEAHQIRRSNVFALKASLELNGFTDITLAHLSDNALAIAKHFEESVEIFDMMIYSGGVSQGKFDYLPNVWTDLGVKKIFHTIAQRPGKPLWFGVHEAQQTAIIGLPGNPVSSLVCLHRYFLPRRPLYATLSEEIIFKKDLTYFVPVKIESAIDGRLWAHPFKMKNSGEFTALAGSDGFIELPAEKSVFASGSAYAFYPWRTF